MEGKELEPGVSLEVLNNIQQFIFDHATFNNGEMTLDVQSSGIPEGLAGLLIPKNKAVKKAPAKKYRVSQATYDDAIVKIWQYYKKQK